MEWENKIELVKLLNQSKFTEATNLVLENIKGMDNQAWDMFFNGMTLTTEVLEADIDNHKKINGFASKIQTDSMRSAMRMALYETLVEELNGEL